MRKQQSKLTQRTGNKLTRVLLMLLLFVGAAFTAAAQTGFVEGNVTDSQGIPLPGANVFIKGTTLGTITDIDGNYKIEQVPVGAQTVVISFMGFGSKEQPVTVAEGHGAKVEASLTEDVTQFEEVVAVGYGVQKKKLVTGATVEVKGDDIQKMNTTQVLGALQSQSPGVNIQSASGQPGDGFKISIRGAGTNGNTAPIYVIDGVTGGDINALNPADIERIDVLKDAASCAIYGSSAANGVIIVTTKSGKAGKMQVTYDANIGISNVYKEPDLLNAQEYMSIMDKVSINGGGTAFNWSEYLPADLLAAYQNGSNTGTNWVEELENKNAISTNHSVNISGGNEMSKFSVGFGYQYQDGIFTGPSNSDYNRYTMRANSEHILWKGSNRDIIKFGENIYFMHAQKRGIENGDLYNNSLSTCIRSNPLIPVYNSNGEYVMFDDLTAMGIFGYDPYSNNPMAMIDNTRSGNNTTKNYNLNTAAWLDIQPVKNLTYKVQASYKFAGESYRAYQPVYKINGQGRSADVNTTYQNMEMGWNWSITNTLNYKFDLAEKSHLDVLAGTEYSLKRPIYGEGIDAQASGNVYTDFEHGYLTNTSGSGILSGDPYEDVSKLSYFGRVNYDFSEKYMLSVIVRADGSSKFNKDNRWGYFPSFSAGWVVTNEDFLKNSNIVNFMKVRAGWGQNGNDNIPNSNWKMGYTYDEYGYYAFNGDSKNAPSHGAYPNRLANPDLTWETSEQTNIGVDLRFLDSHLNVTADWYNKKTKDLLLAVTVPSEYGFANQYQNAGTVKNTGFELSASYNNKIGKDFTYTVGANVAFNKNEVTEVKNNSGFIEVGQNLLSQGLPSFVRMEEGYAIGYFYGYKTAGVIQNASDLQSYLDENCSGKTENSIQGSKIAPGDLKFVDVDGDGKITTDDKTEIGDPNPDVTMGVNISLGYKGFDFSITGYGAFGQQVARNYRKGTDSQFENWTSEVYDYWTGEGTSNRYPLLEYGGSSENLMQVSDIYIDDAGYFRIQNVTLGYDFKHLFKNLKLKQLRFYVSVQNLYTFTNYIGMDPENGNSLLTDNTWATGIDLGNYPTPRTVLFGVNVKF